MDNFESAKAKLQSEFPQFEIISVNGCLYGKEANSSQRVGTYWKLCGQDFWRFISGNDQLYIEIIEPLGHRAKYQNDLFQEAYDKIINRFTLQFGELFCMADGAIDWEKIVRFVSERHSTSNYPFG
jgi:hypothetical protein